MGIGYCVTVASTCIRGSILIQEGPDDSTYKQRVLSEAGYIVNDLLQEEIRRQSSSEKENLHTDPPFLNTDVYLQDINPLLVHFITSATQTLLPPPGSTQLI